jgi:hypothetical protein
MIRSTEQSNSGSLLYKEAVDLLKNSIHTSSENSPELSNDQIVRMNLMKEIQDLENKIEEVSQLLCKTSLEYMVRFQLKDDLEYYHSLIEDKRHQLGS